MVSHTHTLNYIHRTRGHNPSCSSKYSAYWSDPFCGISKGIPHFSHIFVPVSISFSSNFAMHLFSVVPCLLPMCYWGKPPLNESPPQTCLWVIGASLSEPHLMKVPLKPAYGLLGQAGVSPT